MTSITIFSEPNGKGFFLISAIACERKCGRQGLDVKVLKFFRHLDDLWGEWDNDRNGNYKGK